MAVDSVSEERLWQAIDEANALELTSAYQPNPYTLSAIPNPASILYHKLHFRIAQKQLDRDRYPY
jgi:hypothetical protein